MIQNGLKDHLAFFPDLVLCNRRFEEWAVMMLETLLVKSWRRRIATCVAAIALVEIPTEALAGQIYGQITSGGKSVSENVQVQITCSGVPPASTRTDRFGSYQLYVATNGRCQISVNFGGAAIVGDIVSYERPIRYNFDIVREGTRPQLIRR